VSAIIHRPGEGENIEVAGSALSFKLTESDGAPFAFAESTIAPGFPGPPLHIHHKMHDTFYVLEGTLTMQVEEETVEAPPGTFVSVSPRTPHTFSNPSDSAVRVLNIFSPPGFEGYLRKLAAEIGAGGEMPTPERIGEIASEYDYEPVGPPSGD
jgi:mannose-6-phosphate isomerase-like protein (cupin superfamily)